MIYERGNPIQPEGHGEIVGRNMTMLIPIRLSTPGEQLEHIFVK